MIREVQPAATPRSAAAQIFDAAADLAGAALRKKRSAPPRSQIKPRAAPASKYSRRFSSISLRVLLGESTSTQISGAAESAVEAGRLIDRFLAGDVVDFVLAMPATASPIEKRPEVCGGEACLTGTRIPVWLLEQARRLKTPEDSCGRIPV